MNGILYREDFITVTSLKTEFEKIYKTNIEPETFDELLEKCDISLQPIKIRPIFFKDLFKSLPIEIQISNFSRMSFQELKAMVKNREKLIMILDLKNGKKDW